MRYQDYISEQTQKAADEAFRYARAVPADKADWKPLDAGRSVLDQCREMAKCPDWAYSLVSGTPPDWSEDVMAEQQKEMKTWATVDQCHEECKARLAKLIELYKSVPDDRLANTQFLPFDGG